MDKQTAIKNALQKEREDYDCIFEQSVRKAVADIERETIHLHNAKKILRELKYEPPTISEKDL